MYSVSVGRKVRRKSESCNYYSSFFEVEKDITGKYMINRLCSVWFKNKDISDTENRMTEGVEAGKAEWSHT